MIFTDARLRIPTLLLIPFLLLGAPPLQAQTFEPSLAATLEIAETLETGESVPVQFSLKNDSSDDVRMLVWGTPLEGVYGRIFKVLRNGDPVPYEGIVVRRGEPTADDYIVIPAGQSVSAEVDLAKSYNFSAAAEYEVAFVTSKAADVRRATDTRVATLATMERAEISSQPVRVRVNTTTPRTPQAEPQRRLNREARQATYNSCSAAEEGAAADADFAANLWSIMIVDRLEALTVVQQQNYALHQTWFGAWNAGRYQTVLDTWRSLENVFNHEDITYDCSRDGCGAGWYAYVYAGGPNEVWLCDAFFTSGTTGYYSQATTIIHELSHESADTDDIEYGTAACQTLATNDPASAIINADNYAFFQEDFRVANPIDIGEPHKVLYAALLVAVMLMLYASLRARRRSGIEG